MSAGDRAIASTRRRAGRSGRVSAELAWLQVNTLVQQAIALEYEESEKLRLK
jgi:hypothetical protein